MKKVLFIIMLPLLSFGQKGCNVFGDIKVVRYGGDYKIRTVTVGEDLRVTTNMIGGGDKSGEWNIVSYGEDFTVEFVEVGEDFTVKFDDINYGCQNSKSRGFNPALINRSATVLSDAIDNSIKAFEKNKEKNSTYKGKTAGNAEKITVIVVFGVVILMLVGLAAA